MGNYRSGRWHGHVKKQTVDNCRRLRPREAQHVGIGTTVTAMPHGGQKLWLLCPGCGRRVAVLYQPLTEDSWGCRKCHGLSYTSRQRKVNPPRHISWPEWVSRHPLWKAWQTYCSNHPYGVSPQDDKRMTEILTTIIYADLSYEEARRRGAKRAADGSWGEPSAL